MSLMQSYVGNSLLLRNDRRVGQDRASSHGFIASTKDSSEEMRRLRPEGRIFGLGQADAPTAASLEFTFAVFGTADPSSHSKPAAIGKRRTTMLTLFSSLAKRKQ